MIGVMGGRNRTSFGDSTRRQLRSVPDRRLPPLPLPVLADGEWPAEAVRFWNALTGDPARREWSSQHHSLAVLCLTAFARATSPGAGPGWSAELRRLLALIPGGATEGERPLVVRADGRDPSAPSAPSARRDPRLA